MERPLPDQLERKARQLDHHGYRDTAELLRRAADELRKRDLADQQEER